MLINLSNHPSSRWDVAQLNAAHVFGDIVDIPFPAVDPNDDEKDISELANVFTSRILALSNNNKENVVVHVMGEMTLTYAIIAHLHTHGISCIASTTQRMIEETSDGKKIVAFHFVKFRRY